MDTPASKEQTCKRAKLVLNAAKALAAVEQAELATFDIESGYAMKPQARAIEDQSVVIKEENSTAATLPKIVRRAFSTIAQPSIRTRLYRKPSMYAAMMKITTWDKAAMQ